MTNDLDRIARYTARREIVLNLARHETEIERDQARQEAGKLVQRAAILLARAGHDALAGRAIDMLNDMDGIR